jgi:hypothetical protein
VTNIGYAIARYIEEELKLELQITLQHQNNAGKATTWDRSRKCIFKGPSNSLYKLISI